jgi:hypothetical protein
MGVGMGFAIAAQVVHPGKKVVAIEGDSAFGFSGMEIEVTAPSPQSFYLPNELICAACAENTDHVQVWPQCLYGHHQQQWHQHGRRGSVRL